MDTLEHLSYYYIIQYKYKTIFNFLLNIIIYNIY